MSAPPFETIASVDRWPCAQCGRQTEFTDDSVRVTINATFGGLRRVEKLCGPACAQAMLAVADSHARRPGWGVRS